MSQSRALGAVVTLISSIALTVAVACSSDATETASTTADAGGSDAAAVSEGGASDGGRASCLAVGKACDSERDCCSGFCPGHACADPNVDMSAGCASVTPCGGDPSGTWKLASGCAAPKTPCDKDGRGAITLSDALTITAAGPSGTVTVAHDLHACGWVTQGSTSVNAPGALADGGFGGGWPYCVQGTTLWLFPTHSPNPESFVTAIKLMR